MEGNDKTVTVPGKTSALKANLFEPMALAGKAPAVVLVHGFGGNRHEARNMFVWLSRMLSGIGIWSLRIDCHGFGETGGDAKTVNIETMIDDAICAVDFLKGQALVDSEKIGLMGLSMGGLAAACAAAMKQVAGLCLWEAPFDALLGLSRHCWPTNSHALVQMGGHFGVGGFDLGVQFVEALERLNVRELMKDFQKPVLIVHGTADAVVPVETVRLWNDALPRKPHVVLVPAADHGFTEPNHTLQAICQTLSFFSVALNTELLKSPWSRYGT